MKFIKTQEEPIDLESLLESGASGADGADVIFIGRVRDNSRGKQVRFIDYEIYNEMALKELNKIADEAISEWRASRIIIVHRFGRVAIAESSIVIIVSVPHRDDGYRASRYIIDEIKKRVPIWKKESYTDGSEWISERN